MDEPLARWTTVQLLAKYTDLLSKYRDWLYDEDNLIKNLTAEEYADLESVSAEINLRIPPRELKR